METETQTRDEVQATMNYVADPEHKPVSYMYQPPEVRRSVPGTSANIPPRSTTPGPSLTSCRWTARGSS
jgi:hypothetical protein